MLAFDPQRLAAGDQDVDLRRFLEETLGRGGGGGNDMFAAIQDKQEATAVNEGEHASHWVRSLNGGVKTKRGCDRKRKQRGIGQSTEIDKKYRILKIVAKGVRDRDGNRRLSHPASPHHADQTVRPQHRRQFGDGCIPPHHPRWPRRQPGRPQRERLARRQRARSDATPLDARHEAIAANPARLRCTAHHPCHRQAPAEDQQPGTAGWTPRPRRRARRVRSTRVGTEFLPPVRPMR